MSKFTTKERLEIYEKALEIYPSYKWIWGLCFVLTNATIKIWHEVIDFNIENFPEFLKHKPKDKKVNEYWFEQGDCDSRINCLNQCIEECKKLLENE